MKAGKVLFVFASLLIIGTFNEQRTVWVPEEKQAIPFVTQEGFYIHSLSKEHLYVVGGLNNQPKCALTGSKNVAKYDFAKDEWTELPSLPRELHHNMGALIEDRFLFSIGGDFGCYRKNMDEVYFLDLMNVGGSWHKFPSLLEPRGAATCGYTSSDSSIHCFAGETNARHEVFDLSQSNFFRLVDEENWEESTQVEGKWIYAESIPPIEDRNDTIGRDHITSVIVEDTFYVWGSNGHSKADNVPKEQKTKFQRVVPEPMYSYNTTSKIWRIHDLMHFPPRVSSLGFSWKNYVVVMGGEHITNSTRGAVFDDIYALDTTNEMWYESELRLRRPLFGAGSVVREDWVYVFGGGTCIGASAVDSFDAYPLDSLFSSLVPLQRRNDRRGVQCLTSSKRKSVVVRPRASLEKDFWKI